MKSNPLFWQNSTQYIGDETRSKILRLVSCSLYYFLIFWMLRNFDSLCYENKIHLLLESFVIFNKNIQNSIRFLLKKKKIKMIIALELKHYFFSCYVRNFLIRCIGFIGISLAMIMWSSVLFPLFHLFLNKQRGKKIIITLLHIKTK